MGRIRRRILLALLLLVLLAPAGAAGELSKVYPGRMGWSQQGLFPVCGADDVWRLKSFRIEQGRDVRVSCRDATVAFGVHEGNVLWACVFPDEPAKIEASGAGNGEEAKTIFLRFPPAEIDEVFPPTTVGKQGDAWLRSSAYRIARHKIGWRWCTGGGNPTIVGSGWRLLDMDTVSGPRRFYGIDTKAGKVEYVAQFEGSPVPPSPPISKEDAEAAFDRVWQAFDETYPLFELDRVNWKKLGRDHRKELARVETVFDAAAVISDLLANLENLHISVRVGNEYLPGYTRDRPLNANWAADEKWLGKLEKAGDELFWGRKGDLGYLNVAGLSDPGLPDQADAALEALKDTKGLVVDLRYNGGGDELLAQRIAGRFLDERRVYSLNQYRSGPKHNQLGPKLERAFEPRGPWRYDRPVVVLWGRKTLSSAESMALMFAQCPQVTTMGDFTGGSSANPRLVECPGGITVRMPTWLDMDPDGRPIEHVGIRPDRVIDAKPEEFTPEKDPVLEAAFEFLAKKT